MTEPTEERQSVWHVDRTIPLSLIFAILAQTVAAVWWASTISGKVEHLSYKVLKLENAREASVLESKDVAVRLARLEATAASQLEVLKEIRDQRRP